MIPWFYDSTRSAEPVEIGVVLPESGTDMDWELLKLLSVDGLLRN